MPYILANDRSQLKTRKKLPATPGELNFVISQAVCDYLNNVGVLSYDVIGDIVNAMEAAKLEFYRRVAGPYEDKKKQLNGDVYPKWAIE